MELPEWTAQYIALCATQEMGVFSISNIDLIRCAAMMDGARSTSTRLLKRAEFWQLWHTYAVQRLWAADATAISAGSAHG